MAVKRKATEDAVPRQIISSSALSTKRLALGWGAWEKYHQHGQDLARAGKYPEAIEVLSEALLQRNADTLQIMDSRSAVFCKLKLYDRALNDARHMIRAANQDERGYLRAGRALLLDGKPSKALDIYVYALKTLGESHPKRKTVEDVHAKLAARMSSQYRDPFTHLNNDCLLEIFKHLPFRQIVSMTRVCKAWRLYIRDQPILWSDISFKGSRPPVRTDAIRACIHNSQGRLKKIQLHDVKDILSAVQQVSRCPQLEYVDIDAIMSEYHIFNLFYQKNTLKTMILSDKIPICGDSLWNILKLPNMERIEVNHLVFDSARSTSDFGFLPNLQTVVLDIKRKNYLLSRSSHFKPFWIPKHVPGVSDPEASSDGLQSRPDYFEKVPKLREVQIRSTTEKGPLEHHIRIYIDEISHPKLQKLHLANVKLCGNGTWPETLEYLYLIDCVKSATADFDLSLGFPNLKSLVLHKLDWLWIAYITDMLRGNEGILEVLQIEQCDNISPGDLLHAVWHNPKAFQGVRSLHLHGMGFYNLKNDQMFPMIDNMPNLRELHIPQTRVTGFLIRKIVESETIPIKTLNLKGCLDVSPQAIEYGRSNGLNILRC